MKGWQFVLRMRGKGGFVGAIAVSLTPAVLFLSSSNGQIAAMPNTISVSETGRMIRNSSTALCGDGEACLPVATNRVDFAQSYTQSTMRVAQIMPAFFPALDSRDLGKKGLTDHIDLIAARKAPNDDMIFYDDFDNEQAGQPPASPWITDLSGSARIELDSSRAYGGKLAVKITAQGHETAFIALQDAPVFPLPDNTLYGRAMFFLESAPETQTHWTMIEGSGPSADGSHQIEYRYGGQYPIEKGGVFAGSRLMANYETPPSANQTTEVKSDCWHHAKDETTMPTGRWACLAWEFNGPKDRMKLSLDGRQLDDLTVDGHGQGCLYQDEKFRWQAPVFNRLNLGWEAYQDDGQRSLWIDNVAIADEPLLCPAD